MEYTVDFGLYREDRKPISDEVRERLADKLLDVIEDENLLGGGGIRAYTKLDSLVDKLWIWLWFNVKWLRRTDG